MGLKLLAVLLFLVSSYLCWFALEYSVFAWLLAACIPMLCGIGLALRRRWAGLLWYVLAAGVGVWWLVIIAGMVLRGWRANGVVDYLIDLTPGLLLIAIAAGGSLVVRRSFR